MLNLDHSVAEHLKDIVEHHLLKPAESRYLQAANQILSELRVRQNEVFKEEELAARLCSAQVRYQLVEVHNFDKVALFIFDYIINEEPLAVLFH